jgi:hypothetical protein
MAVKNFNIIIYKPQTENGKAELERRMAQLHAESVLKRVHSLKCPAEQKRQIIENIIMQNQNEE